MNAQPEPTEAERWNDRACAAFGALAGALTTTFAPWWLVAIIAAVVCVSFCWQASAARTRSRPDA